MTLPSSSYRGGEPRAVGDVLGQFLRRSGMKQKLRSPEIYDCWPEVAGVDACKHSRVIGFNNCILYVEVDSAPWLQMLATFRKPDLLSGIGQVMTGVRVRDIKFKIGHSAGLPADPSGKGKLCQTHPSQSPRTTHETSRSSRA